VTEATIPTGSPAQPGTRSALSSSRRSRPREFDRPRFLWVVVIAALAMLFVPVVIVIAYSFNSSRSLVVFQGLTTHWYSAAVSDPDIRASLWASVEIALVTTVAAAVAGTMLAFGLQRGSRGVATVSDATLVARLVSPETATAVALLLLFTQIGMTLDRFTIILGHIALCLPFVTVVVRSRLATLNPEAEDAAMDLGATRMGALRLVALPALWPSIAAASMLAFVLSFDDFVTSYFTSGIGVSPLPIRIYSMLRFGVTPTVNAIGVMMMIITLAASAAAVVLMRVARRRTTTLKPQMEARS
jgi:ABC-type spermidine/putrescine transport system permease subunit II